MRGYRERYNVQYLFTKLDALKHLISFSCKHHHFIDPQYIRSIYGYLAREMSG